MQPIFLTIAIMGLIELVKSINTNDWQNVEIIVSSVLVGAVVGMFGIDHLTVVTGIQYGLSAAGAYRLAKVAGGNP